MSERSGVAAQIGFATETTVGTYQAPTRFFPFESESLTLTKEYIRSKALRSGQLAQRQQSHIATTRSAGGDVQMEFFNEGMGILLNLFHGETVTPAAIAESEGKKQVHKIGLNSPFGKALTAQVGRPDTGGTVRSFSYVGSKILSAKIEVAQGGVTMITLTLDSKDEDTTQSLASATYSTTAVPFTFNNCVAKIGGSEIANVQTVTYNLSIPMNTGRYNLGSSGTKLEPIINDLVAITAEATLEFASMADHERFKKEEVVKLETIAKGAVIDAKATNTATLITPASKQVSSGPTVNGPDIITQSVSFECLANGTEAPLTVETISKDTAL